MYNTAVCDLTLCSLKNLSIGHCAVWRTLHIHI